jgi:hypothetical protein
LGIIGNPPPDIGRYETLFSADGMVEADQLQSEPDGFIPLCICKGGSSLELKAMRRYLVKRRVPRHMYKHFGWVPGSGRLWILIDKHFWQGRSITSCGGGPKYISPPWPKGDSLWNGQALDTDAVVTVCEGVFSAMACGYHAVAICGKEMTDEQAARIACTRASDVMIVLDADATAFAYDMAETLRRHGYDGSLSVHHMLEGDPADGVYGDVVSFSLRSVVERRFAQS